MTDIELANLSVRTFLYDREQYLTHELGHLIGVLRLCHYDLNKFSEIYGELSVRKGNSYFSYKAVMSNKLNETCLLGPAALAQLYYSFSGKIKETNDILELYLLGGANDMERVAGFSLKLAPGEFAKTIRKISSKCNLTLSEVEKDFIRDVVTNTEKTKFWYYDLEPFLKKHFGKKQPSFLKSIYYNIVDVLLTLQNKEHIQQSSYY